MLFFRTAKATKAAVDAAAPMVRAVQMSGGIPDGFWDDAYILGYLQQTIVISAKIATGGAIEGANLGKVLLNSFAAIADEKAKAALDRIRILHSQQNNEYRNGLANAMKSLLVLAGDTSIDNDSDVISARAEAAKTKEMNIEIFGPCSDQELVSGILKSKLFFDKIEQRYRQH